MRWRLVGDVDSLRQRSCQRLRCVSSSSSTRHQSSAAVGDLVLVYVAKLDRFFALDGVCSHVGKLRSSRQFIRSKATWFYMLVNSNNTNNNNNNNNNNNICFASAGFSVTKEPTGLLTDEKRPDGLTLVPWQSGKVLCSDVTVTCPIRT